MKNVYIVKYIERVHLYEETNFGNNYPVKYNM